MRLVCAYCRAVMREDPGTSPSEVSHGMCEPCEGHFEKLWDGMSVSEYLDTLADAVLVVDRNGQVLASNEKLATMFGRESPGQLMGHAFACARSRLPGGCGKTVHCRECTIRRAVIRVHETGEPIARAPAWLRTDAGRIELKISAAPVNGAVKVVVEEAEPGTGNE